MKALSLAIFFALIGSADSGAAAQPVNGSAPISLWGHITTSTTADEMRAFKATLPGKRVELFPGCRAESIYRIIDGQMVSTLLVGINKEAPCYDLLLDDLRKQHGDPDKFNATFGTMIGTAAGTIDTISEKSANIWRFKDRRIRLIKTPGKLGGYNLIYTVRPEKYLY